MTIINFTPIEATIGGVLIGLATTIFFLVSGKLFGISGVVGGVLDFNKTWSWRLLAGVGLALGGFIGTKIYPIASVPEITASTMQIILAGILVGFGTRYGSGCTSGHGVCGISRFSKRSIFATCIFMGFGFLTVFIMKKIGL